MDSVIGLLRGQLTHHACLSGQCNRTVKGSVNMHAFLSGQNVSCAHAVVNPLTPMSDQDRISPYNINTILTR